MIHHKHDWNVKQEENLLHIRFSVVSFPGGGGGLIHSHFFRGPGAWGKALYNTSFNSDLICFGTSNKFVSQSLRSYLFNR